MLALWPMEDNRDSVCTEQVRLHGLSKPTYLSCGAEWPPGRWTGKPRRVEPTTASCRLSSNTDALTQLNTPSHTNEHHNGGWKRSDCWVLAFHMHYFQMQDHSFIHCTHFSVASSLHPSSLPLSLFFFCVCVLHSGQAVWALIWKSSGFGSCLPSWLDLSFSYRLTAWLVHLPSDSLIDWITRRLTNWMKG